MKIKDNVLIKVENEDVENGTFVIPDDVTKIGSDAFNNCTCLKSINIPYSVTHIGSGAFYNCTNLKSINISDSVTYIGNWAFNNCKKLQSINIPNSVTYIGKGVFKYCTRLKYINIPNSVTRIGSEAFEHCKNLKYISIPNNVTHVGEGAFANCKNLIKKGNFKACFITHNKNNIRSASRDIEYEIRKQMSVDDIEYESNRYYGRYHYCTNLYDIFNYWHGNLNDIALFEIEPRGVVIKNKNDSQCVTDIFKLIRRIPWDEAFENHK